MSTAHNVAVPNAARSSVIMAAGTLVSRGLGFVKTILLTVAIGTATGVADIFSVANEIPNIIYLLIAGGVFNAVLVPQIIKASKRNDGGADYVSRLLTLVVLMMLGLSVLVTLAAPIIMQTLTSDWDPDQLALGVIFALWCLPQIFFYGLYAILGQILNSYGSFGPYMWAPVVNNVVAIGGLLMFLYLMGPQTMRNGDALAHTVGNWSFAQTALVAGTATLGIVLQALVLVWPVKKLGLRLRPRFGWRGIGLSHAARLAVWTMGTMVVGNSTFLVFTKVASIATGARDDFPGAVAGPLTLSVATMVYLLPHSIVALSVATVLFNRMSHAAANGDDAELRRVLSQGLRTVAVATIFGAVSILVLAGPLGMMFGGGSRAAGSLVAIVLTILALGIPFLSANFMMLRAFYSLEDARTPFFIQLILTVVGVGGALLASLFPANWVVFALAGSYTLGNIASVTVSHLFLKRRLGYYDGARIAASHLRMGYAALGSGAAGAVLLGLLGGYNPAGFAWGSLFTAILAIAIVGIIMLVVYLLLLKALRVQELKEFIQPLLRKFSHHAGTG